MSEILILEDDLDLATQWKRGFEVSGHAATIVLSAAEGLTEVRRRKFDLIIADVFVRSAGELVPDGGLILLTKMRQLIGAGMSEWWRTVPIVVVTGARGISGGFDPLKTAEGLRATMTLRKPIEVEDLIETTERLIAEAEAARVAAAERQARQS